MRDVGRDTRIVELDLDRGTERVLIDTPALDLDPAYGHGGRVLFYSSAEAGDLDLWRLDLVEGTRTRLTDDPSLELRPQPLPGDRRLVYLTKQNRGPDTVSVVDLETGDRRVLWSDWIASQTRPALGPNGRRVAVNVPGADRWRLIVLDVAGGPPIQVARDSRLPLMPAWDPAGRSLYFVEADARQTFELRRLDVAGGDVERLSPTVWSWGDSLARLVVTTHRAGDARPVPARLSVLDATGHPALPDAGQPRFDSQNGVVYHYSPGVTTIAAPAGPIRVTATRGLSPPVTAVAQLAAGQTSRVDLELDVLWDPSSEGWYSGDHHFHLNYGGPYDLAPDDLVPILQAEDLDVGTPLVANLHMRLNDMEWWDWERLGSGPPLLRFGQEVRSHLLGHLGLIGISSPHWPWFWAPPYAVYGRDDRPNRSALAHARQQGGVASYVHPVAIPDPFPSDAEPRGLPLELVPDAVLGDLDLLELACLWSDELGTSDAWYRLLNLGLPVAPTAGTDAFPDFYRSMSLGSARVYVHLDGPLGLDAYLDGLRAGRSFVTTGPLVKFEAQGITAGGVVSADVGTDVPWTLLLYSPNAIEHVEIVVNGQIVWNSDALAPARERRYSGRVRVPVGGWIAARVHGGPTEWPVMDSYPFAHTAPIWFGETGSRDPDAARAAAVDLLRWLDVAEAEVIEGYQGAPIPSVRERFEAARDALVQIAGR